MLRICDSRVSFVLKKFEPSKLIPGLLGKNSKTVSAYIIVHHGRKELLLKLTNYFCRSVVYWKCAFVCQVGIGKHDKCSKVRRDPCHPASSATAANVGLARTKRLRKEKGDGAKKRRCV